MRNVLKTMAFIIAALVIIALVLLIMTIVRNNQKNIEEQMGKQVSVFLDNNAYQSNCEGENFKCLDLNKLGKGIDVKLMQAEIIDNKYHYTGSDKEKLFFEVITNKIRERLPSPIKDDSTLELIDYEITKEQTKYMFLGKSATDIEEREYAQKYKGTKEYYEGICSEIYSSKYQRANDTKVKIELYDIDNHLLLEDHLDKEVCT